MVFKLINHNVEGEFWISLPFDDCQDIIRVGHEKGYWKLLFEELKYFSVPLSQRRKTLDVGVNVGVRNTSDYNDWINHFQVLNQESNLKRNDYVEIIT